MLNPLGICQTVWLFIALFLGVNGLRYQEGTGDFVPLGNAELARRKRQAPSTEADTGILFLNETKEYADLPIKEDDHIYYNLTYWKKDKFDQFWIDTDTLLASTDSSVKGEKDHEQLVNSYRKAVTLGMSFQFPFYGHLTQNITIATGGFCYVGDHMHSWLAATQYIAPLMANFETNQADSNIIYVDTGEIMIVEWRNVQLRHQRNVGNFTFQVSLHKNGSIWFVYKDIPGHVSNISDAHHPRKIGLSDAYLFHHVGSQTEGTFSGMGKTRVIYEYHRVEVPFDDVYTYSVIEINPNPVCIALSSCGECMNATIKYFECSWCKPQGKPAFCTDINGRHRRHQDYINGNCKDQGHLAYCTEENEDVSPIPTSDRAKVTSSPKTPVPVPQPTHRPPTSPNTTSDHTSDHISSRNSVDNDEAISKQEVDTQGMSSGGVVAVLFILAIVLMFFAWVLYAYYNPHTRSGQLLIRYRPGRWSWPGNHGDVRYTASVHM